MDVRKVYNSYSLLMEMQTAAITKEISMEVSQKVRKQFTIDPVIPPLDVFPKDSISYYRGTCSFLIIAVLFTTAIKWKQLTCPPIDEWITKIWYNWMLEYLAVREK